MEQLSDSNANHLPAVIIITRTQNRPLLLRRAMQSVLEQTYQDWLHVIVIDGGELAPVDALASAMEGPYRGRLLIIHNPTAVGRKAASNLALKRTQSRWIAMLDDDDTWHPDFLKRCVDALLNKRAPSVRGVATHVVRIMEQIEDTGSGQKIKQIGRKRADPEFKAVRLSELVGRNLMTNNSFVYERDALETVGMYREDYKVLGDWEFNIRFASRFDIDVIPLELAFYHQRGAMKKGALANSFVAVSDDFHFYAAKIQNELLREDLAAGKLGLGTLLSVHSELQSIRARMQETNKRTLAGLLLDVWRRFSNRA